MTSLDLTRTSLTSQKSSGTPTLQHLGGRELNAKVSLRRTFNLIQILGLAKTTTQMGPGDYNTILKSKKNFHVTGGSSMFLSKVQRSELSEKKKGKSKGRASMKDLENNSSILNTFTKEVEGRFITDYNLKCIRYKRPIQSSSVPKRMWIYDIN